MKATKRIIVFLFAVSTHASFAQSSLDWLLEKMPVDLETDFALSSLPPHLRDQATVYLLDPKKGYYIARQGTNGFSVLIARTEWERAAFVQDTYGALSFDPEGTKTQLPVYLDVAEMRASGKYTAAEIRGIVVKRVKDGTYKAPSRTGVSYMLSPLLRTYDENKKIVNLVLPHYMFYAPGVDNSDIGGVWDGHGPFAIGGVDGLDKEHSIFNFIIIPAGETEKASIIESSKDLLRRLGEYKAYLKVVIEPAKGGQHHH